MGVVPGVGAGGGLVAMRGWLVVVDFTWQASSKGTAATLTAPDNISLRIFLREIFCMGHLSIETGKNVPSFKPIIYIVHTLRSQFNGIFYCNKISLPLDVTNHYSLITDTFHYSPLSTLNNNSLICSLTILRTCASTFPPSSASARS